MTQPTTTPPTFLRALELAESQRLKQQWLADGRPLPKSGKPSTPRLLLHATTPTSTGTSA